MQKLYELSGSIKADNFVNQALKDVNIRFSERTLGHGVGINTRVLIHSMVYRITGFLDCFSHRPVFWRVET
jgi:hypothetical protein